MWFKKKETKLDQLLNSNEITIDSIVSIYKESTNTETKDLKKTKEWRNIFENASKEELFKFHNIDLLNKEELFLTGKFEFKEVFGDVYSEIGNWYFLKYAPNDFKLSHLNEFLTYFDRYYTYIDLFELEFKLDSKITLSVSKKPGNTDEVNICFIDNNGRYYINASNILSVSYFENRIVLNRIPSRFKFDEGFDVYLIKNFLDYLHYMSIKNAKRLPTCNEATEQN